ncbi:MAG: UDP-N-acetylmuramoyl-tripeptide--D-alanyl-D-alanine ligase [Deltaproteobacteria bacterium]|nr:UDP-N-acetylmuramoyl-tripeptide--D-alanyl-D-alanine ligase [Deltaproteobacteria bacterium]
MELTIEQVIVATGASVVQAGDAAPMTGLAIDSRKLAPHEWFVAIKGPHFDGHDFVTDLLARGVPGVIVNRDLPNLRTQALTHARTVPWIIRVPDTITALGAIAKMWRARQSALVRIGITGSNGKSTTKEMVASVVGARGPVLKTEGNFNNLIGMPLVLLRLSAEHRTAVIEMGMSEFGEIAAMTEFLDPDVGVITNVAPCHLVSLGTVENVAKAKGELFATMRRDATVVVNQEDRWARELGAAYPGRKISYGMQNACEVQFGRMTSDGLGTTDLTLYVRGAEQRTQIPLPGTHNVMNALAATAVGLALEIPVATIMERLPHFTPMRMRMERVQLENGVQVINDCYNANPLSMQMALRTVGTAKRAGRFLAVLGDMLELGDEALVRHQDVGTQAVAAGVHALFLCGEFAEAVASGARDAGGADVVRQTAPDVTALCEAVAQTAQRGDVVLVKGSRGMQMERVVEFLKQRFGVN